MSTQRGTLSCTRALYVCVSIYVYNEEGVGQIIKHSNIVQELSNQERKLPATPRENHFSRQMPWADGETGP